MKETEKIESSIRFLRGQKVILDSDLAVLYGVKTKVLIQSVKRNTQRFPEDFMFRLTAEEFKNLRSQIVTSSFWGGKRYLPHAFTEQGVAMLSSILNSPKAIQVNIQIMRTFVKLRQLMASNAELARKIDELERKYDGQFQIVFEAIRQLIQAPETRRRKIGYTADHQAKGGFLYERN